MEIIFIYWCFFGDIVFCLFVLFGSWELGVDLCLLRLCVMRFLEEFGFRLLFRCFYKYIYLFVYEFWFWFKYFFVLVVFF